jgi:replicative DNA helicase
MHENFNREAEQSVLGALMMQPDAFDQIHWLTSAMFYEESHKTIYSVLTDMISHNKAVDIVTVAEYLDSERRLVAVGGIAYLGALVQNCAGSANIKRYAEIVQEKHVSRLLYEAIEDIRIDMTAAGDVYKKLNRAQSRLMAISEKSEGNAPQFVADILPLRMERIDDAYQGKIKTISTGLKDLDRSLGGGIENGSLIIVAASSSMGKTSLAVQLAENIQNQEGVSLIFSIEMVNGMIVDRIISAKAKISSTKLRTGQLEDHDWDKLFVAVDPIRKLNMMIDDKTSTLNAMRATARSVKRKHGLNCIVVDYIGLMLSELDSNKRDTREQEISNITRGLKGLAKELDVPVIALSQLNRKVADRNNKRPVMSDLRDSGAIEQDADIILLIYRDEYYNPDTEYKGVAEVNIAKNRNGATGTVMTHFDNEHTIFQDYEGGLPQQSAKVYNMKGGQYD